VVLAVTTAGFLAVQVVSQDVPMLILAVVTALVTITLIGRRRAAIIAAVAITLFTMGIGTITDAEYWSHPRPLAVAALCALSIAAADAVRNRRAYIAAVEERARRAEASREQEAERRVGAERLRIARELHDVLAHHIAVINVQAGVAGHLLERQPQQARAALDHVREAARSVLSEMQAVVTVLREPDEPLHPAEPIPGMDRLADLVDGFRAAGLTIDTVVSGTPTALPAAVDLVAYRTVQESLTNVHKHAGKTAAVVELDYRPDVFALTVTNAGTPTGSRSGARLTGSANDPVTGFGLLGMRERVGSVGGSLQAGPTGDGGFVTAVSLPVSSR
jgi:signal transduction histidine kinase